MKMSEVEDSPFRKGTHHSTTAASSTVSSPEFPLLSTATPPSSAVSTSIEKSAECLLAVLSPSTTADLISSPTNLTPATSSPSNSRKSKTSSGSHKSSSSRNSSYNPESSLESGNTSTPLKGRSGGMPPLNRANSTGSVGNNTNNSTGSGSVENGNKEEIKKEVVVSTPNTNQLENYELDPKSEARESERIDYEEDMDGDDNSVISDMSRGDNPSDSFHTPSTSLQNLSSTMPEVKEYDEMEFETNNISPSSQAETHDWKVIGQMESSPEISYIGMENKSSDDSTNNLLSIATSLASPQVLSFLTQSMESNVSRGSSSSSGNNNGTTKEVLLLPGTYNSKPSKKKMWYHVFTPSYKTRSGEFRKYFKDLPVDERLIVGKREH